MLMDLLQLCIKADTDRIGLRSVQPGKLSSGRENSITHVASAAGGARAAWMGVPELAAMKGALVPGAGNF